MTSGRRLNDDLPLVQGRGQCEGQGRGSQGHASAMSWILAGRPYDTSSIDSQFTDVEEELTVLDKGLTTRVDMTLTTVVALSSALGACLPYITGNSRSPLQWSILCPVRCSNSCHNRPVSRH